MLAGAQEPAVVPTTPLQCFGWHNMSAHLWGPEQQANQVEVVVQHLLAKYTTSNYYE